MSQTSSTCPRRALLERLREVVALRGEDCSGPATMATWAQAAAQETAPFIRSLQDAGLVLVDPLANVPASRREAVASWMREVLPARLRDAADTAQAWWLTRADVDAEWAALTATAQDGRSVFALARVQNLPSVCARLLQALPDERVLAIAPDAELWTSALRELDTAQSARLELLIPPSTAPAAETAKPGLFRSQVQATQAKRLEGEVMLAQPVALRLLGYGAAAAAAALILVASFGHFAKTETASGVLMPISGVTKVAATQTGVVTELAVKSGDIVSQGQHLLTIADARVSGGDVVNKRILEELESSITRTIAERATLVEQGERERTELAATLQAATANLAQVDRQLTLQREREGLLREKSARLEKLLASGVIAQAQVQDQHDQLIAAQLSEAGLAREAQQARTAVRQAQAAVEARPSELATRLSAIDQRTSEFKQRLAEANLRSGVELTAPRAGRVAAVLVKPGEHVGGERNLVLLVDEGEPLQAQLFVPTRGAGFLRVGQEVRLRLQAFPYQRFGYQQGEILEVSRATLSPTEIDAPVQLREPVYAVRVAMNAQTIMAFGKAQALQAGMLLDADIVTDRPRIIEWILEPLFSLRGRH